MKSENLEGKHIRLEPLEYRHVDGLVKAAAGDHELYQWSPVPQTKEEVLNYVATALAWKDAGTAVPYATIRVADSAVIGSTRFWNIENWAWPEGHASYDESPLTPAKLVTPGCSLLDSHASQHRSKTADADPRL